MMNISPVLESELPEVLELVHALLVELGEESSEASHIEKFKNNTNRLVIQPNHHILVAKTGSKISGVITLNECFAIYAGGHYGVINEMYVSPEFRSRNVGAMLLNEAKKLAVRKKWLRIDVTAPIEEKWQRTIKFYETQGFRFTGEKLRLNISY